MPTVEVGELAPEFRLKGPGGQWFSLSDYRGRQNVVLFFYPLAFSPVCSHQLPEVQKRLEEFRKLDAAVFGISVDSHYANEAFARSLKLDFPLLSDFRKQASIAYGVLNTETGYSQRSAFVIGKDGKLLTFDVAVTNERDQVPSNDRLLEALQSAAR